MKKLFKKLKGILTPKPKLECTDKNSLHVVLIDESEKLTESLGISQDRLKDLDKIVINALMYEQKFSKMFRQVSLNVAHANELAYCMYILGRNIELNSGPNPLLKALMK